MKKILALLAGLMTCSAVYALPVYNPDQPELLKYGVFTCGDACWGLEFGYRGDFVFDRKFRGVNQGNLVGANPNRCQYEHYINAGQLTLNLFDRIDLYGWCGENRAAFDAPVDFLSVVPDTPTSGFLNFSGRSKVGFAWGVGARVVLWQCGRTAIGIDGQYSQRRNSLQSLSIDGAPVQAGNFVSTADGGLLDPSNFHSYHKEWQVSLGISHRICWLVPYVAVKYSDFKHGFSGPLFSAAPVVIGSGSYDPKLKFRPRNYVGFVAGVTLVDAERMHVTAEGRFIDERALTIAADLRF